MYCPLFLSEAAIIFHVAEITAGERDVRTYHEDETELTVSRTINLKPEKH